MSNLGMHWRILIKALKKARRLGCSQFVVDLLSRYKVTGERPEPHFCHYELTPEGNMKSHSSFKNRTNHQYTCNGCNMLMEIRKVR